MRNVCISMSIFTSLLRAGAESRGEGSRTNTLASLTPSRCPMKAGPRDRCLFLKKQALSWGAHFSCGSPTTWSQKWAVWESWYQKSEPKTPQSSAMAETKPRQGGGCACLSRAFVRAGEAHEWGVCLYHQR